MLPLLSSLLATLYNPRKVQVIAFPCSSIFDYSNTDAVQCILNTKLEIGKYCAAGAVAGGCRAISRAFTFPLDTIKTLKQLNVSMSDHAINKSSHGTNFYSGLLPATLSAIPSSAVFFVAYNALQMYYDSCAFSHAMAGMQEMPEFGAVILVRKIVFSSLATVPQNVIKIPAEAIKQYLQYASGRKSNVSSFMMTRSLFKSGGWRALYVGGNAQLLREVPYNALQMAFFDMLQANAPIYINTQVMHWVLRVYELATGNAVAVNSETVNAVQSAMSAAVLGCVAACLAAVLTQPADVIKTKMMVLPKQMQPPSQLLIGGDHHAMSKIKRGSDNACETARITADSNIAPDEQTALHTPPTIGSVARQIWLSEGISGYFVGLVPRLLIVSVGGAVYFLAASLVENKF